MLKIEICMIADVVLKMGSVILKMGGGVVDYKDYVECGVECCVNR